jgi:hypothetical protein
VTAACLMREVSEACDLDSGCEVWVMRVEILPSGKRRCHWSSEEKARIVAETLAAGATVAAHL